MRGHLLAIAAALGATLSASGAQARFLQADPAGTKDDLNLYSYTHNSPLNGADPLGLFDCQKGQIDGCSRITGILDKLRQAAQADKTTQKQRDAIHRVLDTYGRLGDGNGVVVGFGPATGSEGGSTQPVGSKIYIKFDAAKIDRASAYSRIPGLASVTAHEGQHAYDSGTVHSTEIGWFARMAARASRLTTTLI